MACCVGSSITIKVLVEDKLAFRLNALHADGDSWRSNTYNRKNAIHGGLTWRPDEKTVIRLGYEDFQQVDIPGTTYLETDFLTHWFSSGLAHLRSVFRQSDRTSGC